MTPDLFELLPAVHRLRDAEIGGPLEALLDVLSAQAEVVERDIARLYDNWFIETADPWVTAYIGDLLGVRPLHAIGRGASSPRAYVANTLAYRRRKGTAAVLEQLAVDVTDWPARAVEMFQLLGATQYAKHVRPGARTVDVRDADGLELLGGPFERAGHTIDVRRIASGRGRYNIPNIALFLWRLRAYRVSTRGSARRVAPAGSGRFTFSPLPLDVPLFNPPQAQARITDLAGEANVPGELRRRALFDELEAARRAVVGHRPPRRVYFTPTRPVVRVFTRSAAAAPFVEVPAEQMLVADLSLWQRPPPTKDYTPLAGPPALPLPIAVAVDPRLGRMTFPAGPGPVAVEVAYAYGFSADMGGGPYDRTASVDRDFVRRVTWQAGVTRGVAPEAGRIFATLGEAVEAWNAQPAGTAGVIAVMDSRTYEEDLTGARALNLKEGSELLVVAADWPEVLVGGVPTRVAGRFTPALRRPHLLGGLAAVGMAAATAPVPGRLRLDGLLIEGVVTVLPGSLGELVVADCTLPPGSGGLHVDPPTAAPDDENAVLSIRLVRSITGAVVLPDTVPSLEVDDSIIDAAASTVALAAPGAAASIRASTVLGDVAVHQLDADGAIFGAAVTVERTQEGCVRFSYVRPDAATVTPRRYRCQPDLAAKDLTGAALDNVLDRVVPTFSSVLYGRPDYLQLGLTCPVEIATGAEDGSEMGAFCALRQPQRQANVRAVLEEYLRFGLEAGTTFVTRGTA